MRRATLAVAALGAVACKEDHSFPVWQDGILVEGDCLDDYEIVDGTATDPVFQIPSPDVVDDASTDPLWHMDNMPDGLGVVYDNQEDQEALWFETMNFNPYPIVDFTTQQSIQIWARNPQGCGLSIDEFHVNTGPDLAVHLDVTFYDPALNCDTGCGADGAGAFADSKAIVMVGIDKTLDAKMCRRIRPGCDPNLTTP